jgi:hypothetical protein
MRARPRLASGTTAAATFFALALAFALGATSARAATPAATPAPPAGADETTEPPISPPAPSDIPSAGLVHEAVTAATRGRAISITVGVQSDLRFERLVLAYRPDDETEFRGREMKPVATGTYAAEIPAQGTTGAQVSYYIEAQDREGAPVAGRGSPGNPLVIALAGARLNLATKGDDERDEEEEEPAPATRYFVALLVGSGAGWTAGNGDTNADVMFQPAGFAPAQLGQFAPELGYWWSSTLMLSVQGRFQRVTGTRDLHADGRVFHGANYAAAGFAKATWLGGGRAAIRPFFSLAAGVGQIRHVVTLKMPDTCGPRGDQVCVDSIAAGPFGLGPGGGLMAEVTEHLTLVLQVNTQLTFPSFTFNVDGNVGVAFRF